MFASKETTDEVEMENMELIATIFTYLTPKELRNARLVNFAFNKIITEHPNLFWRNNMLHVRIRSCGSGNNERQLKREWTNIRLHPLITDYNCPNIHFSETDLQNAEAVAFFHSAIRYQIRYLVLTKCSLTFEILMHILPCIGKTLKYLKIEDFSKFEGPSSAGTTFIEPRSIPYLFFPSLTTLILSRTRYSSSSTAKTTNSSTCELPRDFLHAILNGSCKLENICLYGWNAKTRDNFTKQLVTIDPGKLQNLLSLEILCTTEKDLKPQEQYGFLNSLGWTRLPNLKSLKIHFDTELFSMERFSQDNELLVESITKNVATFIERSAHTLESIKLINCPVSNNVFRSGTHSFPRLCKINTSGSFVTRLDDEANLIYKQSKMNINIQHRDGSGSGRSDNASRIEMYKMACAMLVVVIIVHTGTRWAFGSYIGEKLEILILSAIVLWLTKGDEILEMWTSLLSR